MKSRNSIILFIILALSMGNISCSTNNEEADNNETNNNQNCTPSGETITILAGDANFHTLSLCANQFYTLSFDFSNHNFDSDTGESDGWRQNYEIDWGITTKQYSFEVGDITNSEIFLPKSSICFIPNENMEIKVKIRDSSYGDNTGSVIVKLELGSVGFNGSDSMTIQSGDNSFHSISISANSTKTLSFDFSNHSFDSDEGEINGWRQNYEIDWGISTIPYSFEVGDLADPKILIPKSSVTIIPMNNLNMSFRVMDTSYSDNTGNVIVKY